MPLEKTTGLGSQPPLLFNPCIHLDEEEILCLDEFKVCRWMCKFLQMDEKAQRLGIFYIRTFDDRRLFVAFSDEKLHEANRAFHWCALSSADIKIDIPTLDEALRKFEAFRPVNFDAPFNLKNFMATSDQMNKLSRVLSECYDWQSESLLVVPDKEAFEEVVRNVIADHAQVMNPYSQSEGL